MLKVVLDTNVIISGFNFAGSKPAKILELVACGDIVNFVSDHIIKETRDILIRKFFWTEEEAESAEFWLKTFSKVIKPQARISVIAHDPDNRILECALEAQADYIISGDRHLTDLKIYRGIEIVSPARSLKFLKELEIS